MSVERTTNDVYYVENKHFEALQVSPCCIVSKDKVIAIFDAYPVQARTLYNKLVKQKKVIHSGYRRKVTSLVILDNGMCITSPYTLEQLYDNYTNHTTPVGRHPSVSKQRKTDDSKTELAE